LYLRDIVSHVDAGIAAVQAVLVRRAEEHLDRPMPGYTHLQRAQPVLLAHHLLAYVFMLARDRERFRDGAGRINVMPLGAAARGVPAARSPSAGRPSRGTSGSPRPARTAWPPCPTATSSWSS